MLGYMVRSIMTDEKFYYSSIESIMDNLMLFETRINLFWWVNENSEFNIEEVKISFDDSIIDCLKYLGYRMLFSDYWIDNPKVELFYEIARDTGIACMVAAVCDREDRIMCLIDLVDALNDFVDTVRIKSREMFLPQN
jgi:hypothetical protein